MPSKFKQVQSVLTDFIFMLSSLGVNSYTKVLETHSNYSTALYFYYSNVFNLKFVESHLIENGNFIVGQSIKIMTICIFIGFMLFVFPGTWDFLQHFIRNLSEYPKNFVKNLTTPTN